MADEKKTALEIILELPSLFKRMEARINVLDTNLKILNSKLNKMKVSTTQEPETQNLEEEKSEQDQPKRFLPTATPGPVGVAEESDVQAPVKQSDSPKKLVLGPIKVYSTIRTTTGKPVDGMTINIFDSSNELIRELKTNKEGYWECKLPSGKYSLEMIHPRLKTINKIFELQKNMKEFEVT